MTRNEILELKRESQIKWAEIANDLCEDKPKLWPRLTGGSCGYCKIYAPGGDCGACCLDDGLLCQDGMGDAFGSVRGYYGRNKPADNRTEALRGAMDILVAIVRDIEEEEK